MKNFFKYALATIVGILALNFFGFLIFMMIAGIASSSDKTKVKENTVLVAKFNKPVIDRANENPFSQLTSGSFDMEGNLGLDQVLEDIEKAKTDENIDGIFLKLTTIPMGMATLEEVRDALVEFKESGKFIVAHSDTYSHKSYYLASVADSIFLTPTGNLGMSGLSVSVNYYKKALEKLGVKMQVVRHGSYKAAVEPFLINEMSDENREQLSAMIGTMWGQMMNEISIARNVSVEKLNKYADELTLLLDQNALEEGMIDGLKYYDEILSDLKTRTGIEEKKDLNAISLNKYADVPSSVKKDVTRDKVAVVYAMGSVVTGEAEEGKIGSDRIARAIRKARRDKSVKAIVLRVNSGGGSALASEVIYREMKLASEVKPVVASLGDVAASGGYYIVCPADTIVASETTITGSIGVFGLFPSIEKLMEDKIGINSEVVKTNKHSDLGALTRSFTAEEEAFLQLFIDDTYSVFAQHVADGRGLTYEQVDAIGGGRVWTGRDAMEIGLIDVFGGLEKSIEIAAEMAELENYRVSSLPTMEDPFTAIMKQFSGDVKIKILQNELGDSYQLYKKAQDFSDIKGIQAIMPFELEIY